MNQILCLPSLGDIKSSSETNQKLLLFMSVSKIHSKIEAMCGKTFNREYFNRVYFSGQIKIKDPK